MSDETPQAGSEPETTPAPPETPAAETPATKTPTTEEPAVPVATAPAAEEPAVPVTPAPAAAAPPERAGFFVPHWVGLAVLAVVAILIIGGIGYAIGHSAGSDNGSNASSSRGFPNGNFPGNRGNQGNGPFGGNGNGNSNGNGNREGGGSTTSSTAFLGVSIADGTGGAQVTGVASGSPAADAGLKSGDVITAVDGDSVSTASALAQAIHSHNSGDQVTITYTRAGSQSTAKVTLANSNDSTTPS